MSDPPDFPSPPPPPPAPLSRWQALFQRADDPVFLLNRQRRFLFVNQAWERWTGVSAAEARGLACLRRAIGIHDPWDVIIRVLCCPPPEVLEGKPGRVRRLLPNQNAGRAWWDLSFLPLREAGDLLCILGRITAPAGDPTAGGRTAPADSLAEQLAALHTSLAGRLPDKEKEHLWRPERLIALREHLLERHSPDRLTSALPALRRIAEQVRLAGQTGAPVLIVGEPGTGKRWLARSIHAAGPTREQAFLALSCGQLPPAAVAETLFGAGPLQATGVGTLYLEEPASLPRDLQARLCAWLDEAEPRVIAGCQRDPAEDVHGGRLMEDLHCALGTLVLQLPPLRQRKMDLPHLVEGVLEQLNREGERRIVGLTEAAWEVVRAYHWPGNLTELRRVLFGAREHARAERIDAADLPVPLRLAVGLEQEDGPREEKSLPLDQLLEDAERRLILLALERARGNKTRAAELLSVWRPRLLRRMEALGISSKEEAPRAAGSGPAPAP
jgi:DNA-binding NtrC family response regulator